MIQHTDVKNMQAIDYCSTFQTHFVLYFLLLRFYLQYHHHSQMEQMSPCITQAGPAISYFLVLPHVIIISYVSPERLEH